MSRIIQVMVAAMAAASCHPSPSPSPSPLYSPSPAPKPPSTAISDAIAVSVSDTNGQFGCIIRRDRTVWCWGGSDLAFARGRTTPIPGPWQVPGIDDAIALHSGESTIYGNGTCVVRSNHTAVCSRAPTFFKEVPLTDVVDIVRGDSWACGLRRDGTVHCGPLNRTYAGPKELPWEPLPGAEDIVQISGTIGTCALRKDGRLLCWGPHPFRGPGDGYRAEPKIVKRLPPAQVIRVGAGAGCLLTSGKGVVCAIDGKQPRLVKVEPHDVLVHARDITLGMDSLCALVRDQVWCTRAGDYSRARRLNGVTDAVEVRAGRTHACVVTQSGRVLCWGKNNQGQLGNGRLRKQDGLSWLKWYRPALLDGPGEGRFGCKASLAVRKECTRMEEKKGATLKACALEPPPDHWNYRQCSDGPNYDPRCAEAAARELEEIRVPICMCTCSEAYQRKRNRQRRLVQ